MRNLLERWAAAGDTAIQEAAAGWPLEHPRCYEHSPGEPDGFCVVHGGFWHGWRVNPEQPADLAHIQAAVQEAITARGWTWRLNGPSFINGQREWGPTATVFGDRLGSALGYHGEYGEEVPAAHALLAAYLEAIEEAKRRARIDERWEARA